MTTTLQDSMKTVVRFFTDTPSGQALVAQAQEAETRKVRERRAALLAERKGLLDRQLSLIRAHEPKRKHADAEIEKARAALTAAESAKHRLEYAHRNEYGPLDRRLDHITWELYAS